jgi:hypothetical protein
MTLGYPGRGEKPEPFSPVISVMRGGWGCISIRARSRNFNAP